MRSANLLSTILRSPPMLTTILRPAIMRRGGIAPIRPIRTVSRARLIAAVVALGCAVALTEIGPVVAGPFVALARIKSAVDRHDAAALASLVDFDRLRSHLKRRHVAPPPGGGPIAGVVSTLRSAIQGRLVEFAVDRLVTPSTIARILYGRRLWQAVSAQSVSPPAAEPLLRMVSRIGFTWESSDRFRIRVSQDDGSSSMLLLVRNDTGWRIGDLAP